MFVRGKCVPSNLKPCNHLILGKIKSTTSHATQHCNVDFFVEFQVFIAFFFFLDLGHADRETFLCHFYDSWAAGKDLWDLLLGSVLPIFPPVFWPHHCFQSYILSGFK